MASSVEPGAVMRAAAAALARLLGVREVYLLTYDAGADVLRLGACVPNGEATAELSLAIEESLPGQVLQSGRPLMTDHLERHPLVPADLSQLFRPGRALFVPFFHQEQPVGVLIALGRRARPFGEEDVRLVRAVTAQVVLSIANERLYENARKQARRLATILVVNKRLALGPELEEMLSVITEEAARLLGVDAAGLRLLEGDELVRGALFGQAEVIMLRERLRLGESLSGRVAQENRAIAVEDLPDDPRHDPLHRAQAAAYGLRAWLGVPLHGREGIAGVLFVVDREKRVFGLSEIQLLEAFADQAAIAIDNARLYRGLAERERRLHDLVGRLFMAQEEERRRVAYDVHDGLAQVAAAAQQHLEAFASRARPRSAARRQELGRARHMARLAVQEARRVIAGLRPTALDDFGLATALRLEAESLQGDGWEVEYREALGRARLPSRVETALYRVAQEALENVRKHAGQSRVRLLLRQRGRWVRLEIRDWGRGFQPAAVLANSGPSERVGLRGMEERIAWLGGRCTVRSRPGSGTRILAEVPLATTSAEAADHGR